MDCSVKHGYKIKNLVLSGGGFKGFSLIGAYKALQDYQCTDQIERIIGTSIGAFIGLLIVLKYNSDDLYSFITSFNYEKLKNMDFVRFFENWGLESGDKFEKFIQVLVRRKLNLDNTTFIELHKYKPIEFTMTVTHLNQNQVIYYNYKNTPNESIVLSCRKSISLPIAICPIRNHQMKSNYQIRSQHYQTNSQSTRNYQTKSLPNHNQQSRNQRNQQNRNQPNQQNRNQPNQQSQNRSRSNQDNRNQQNRNRSQSNQDNRNQSNQDNRNRNRSNQDNRNRDRSNQDNRNQDSRNRSQSNQDNRNRDRSNQDNRNQHSRNHDQTKSNYYVKKSSIRLTKDNLHKYNIKNNISIDYFIDGGLKDCFPIQFFPDSPETLGLLLDDHDDQYDCIENIIDYLLLIIRCLMTNTTHFKIQNIKHSHVIHIELPSVDTIKFDSTYEERCRMYKVGYRSVVDYFKKHK